MRTLGSLLTLGLFVLAVGCGSSSGGGGTGGSGGHGGNLGLDGGGTGGGIDSGTGGANDAPISVWLDGGTGGIDSMGGGAVDTASGGEAGPVTCNYPSCVSAVLASCQPVGACVRQASATGVGTATCFENGVAVVSGVDTATFETTMTYKSAGKTCYSIAIAGISSGAPTYTFKDAAGVVLGGGGVNMTTGSLTFACAGGSNVDVGCGLTSLMALSGASATCATGVCAP
jgi:hypothetical protein